VVPGHPFHEALGLVGEHDERADYVEEPGRLEYAADQDFEGGPVGHDLPAVDGLPRRVVLPASRERAHERGQAVRHDTDGIGSEHGGDVAPVRLHLVPGTPHGRVLRAGVLQLDERKRQTVHEDQHVGTADLVSGHRELVHDEPVVVVRVVPVDQPGQRCAHGTVDAVLDWNSLHQ